MYMNGTHQDTPHDTSRYIKIHQDTYRIGNYTKSYRKLHVTQVRGRGRVGGRVGSGRSPVNPVSFPGKHPPPPTPTATSEVSRPRPRGDPTRPLRRRLSVIPHPRTLESQTLKMREPVRRRFVTDLPGFRRLLIGQGGVSSHREISGNKNSYIVD